MSTKIDVLEVVWGNKQWRKESVNMCSAQKLVITDVHTQTAKSPWLPLHLSEIVFQKNSITILLFFQGVLVTQHNSYLQFRVEPRIEQRIDNSASALKCMCRSV